MKRSTNREGWGGSGWDVGAGEVWKERVGGEVGWFSLVKCSVDSIQHKIIILCV